MAFAVFEEAIDRCAGQMRRGLFVVGHELYAVEAHQSALGCQPDVAVPGLENGVDSILRKAAIGLPRAMTKLAQIFLRVEAERHAG
jgi:hypothetical protein